MGEFLEHDLPDFRVFVPEPDNELLEILLAEGQVVEGYLPCLFVIPSHDDPEDLVSEILDLGGKGRNRDLLDEGRKPESMLLEVLVAVLDQKEDRFYHVLEELRLVVWVVEFGG